MGEVHRTVLTGHRLTAKPGGGDAQEIGFMTNRRGMIGTNGADEIEDGRAARAIHAYQRPYCGDVGAGGRGQDANLIQVPSGDREARDHGAGAHP
jgi:hypothetical protein